MKRNKTYFIGMIVVILFCLSGCVQNKSYDVRITIPAGSTEEFVYSEEEVSSNSSYITLASTEKLGDTEVVLKAIESKEGNAYEPQYITPGAPVKAKVEKGVWFKIGVSVQNPTDKDIDVYVNVKNVTIRIE